jgi:hypothetical protein
LIPVVLDFPSVEYCLTNSIEASLPSTQFQ